MGVGGGTVSREAQRNLDKAEDLCRRKKPEKAIPFLLKALEDPNNLDAAVQMAFLMPNLDMSVSVLDGAAQRGREHMVRIFGPQAFDDEGSTVGHFWGLIETRPYMRVLQALVRTTFEKKDYARSADTIIETLRLCPGDNMGQREWLGSILLKAGRPADALSFIQAWLQPDVVRTGNPPPRGGCAFPPPSQKPFTQQQVDNVDYWEGAFAYTGALAVFKLWGDCELARQFLFIAAKINPHVLQKILARIDQPSECDVPLLIIETDSPDF
ncbi:uncharacterized protein FIBRA_04933 [Fibroporia radiculosa]|uniref:Uncharacterized protein n=1 Tax=Fibroporia radiculosa TaxID=599839 RepID=J4IAF5_9APHY|nr:uncharacterized protein FIBRA_04933 [Fibroporia radiculosa]CCM02821.1 predicted protein [Fibroporia radiculosa]